MYCAMAKLVKTCSKKIITSESGAVQVAAYCLLNFDSQATEVEAQEILGVINAAVQRAIDTRIEVRQVSSPSIHNELPQEQAAAVTAKLPKMDRKIERTKAVESPAYGKAKDAGDRPQPPITRVNNTSPTQASVKSPSDHTPQLPLIQPQPRTTPNRSAQPVPSAQQTRNTSSNGKSRSAKSAHKRKDKDQKKNSSGLQKWFNQTLGMSNSD
jgi:hypothetical protein